MNASFVDRSGLAVTSHRSDGGRSFTGRTCAVLSIALFVFLLTFWVVIAPVKSSPNLAIWTAMGSIAMLLAGAIFGLIAIIYRQKPDDRGSLVLGIIGLCVHGLFLVGFPSLIFIAAMVTVIRTHRQTIAPRSEMSPPRVVYRPVITPQPFHTWNPVGYPGPVYKHHHAFN